MIRIYTLFIVLFIFTLWLLSPAFETIDDFFMVQIVSGKYGHHPSELMLYSSPIYGKVLVLLYHFIPSFNWYYFFFLLLHLASWLVILDVLIIPNNNPRFAILLFTLLFSTFGFYFLGNLQFTTTAFISALGGLLLVMKNKNNASIITGLIMILLASMIRLYSVWFLGCLVLPWFIYKWVFVDGFFKIWNHKKSILIILGIGLMTLVIRETGKSIYSQTISGKTLRSFIFERGKLIDNPNFVFSPANFNAFKNVNWTEEDFKIFSGYYFDPATPFNPENLINIHDHLKILKPDQSRIFKGFVKLFQQSQIYCLLLLMIIGAVLSKRIVKKDIFFALLQTGSIFVFLAYLLFFNDFKARVILPLIFIASVFIIMYILRKTCANNFSETGSFRYINYSIVIFIAIAIYVNFEATRERKTNDKELKRQIALINGIEKDFLVVHGYDLPTEHASLKLINNGLDLKGKVYFTMPSCLMHYLTGSKKDEYHRSVFDLLCSRTLTILLLHNDKTLDVAGLLQYSSNKTNLGIPAYSKIALPGMEYDLYLKYNHIR